MNDYFLYIIPTAIILLTYFISRLIEKGFGDYLSTLNSKVQELEGVLNLTFMKELLNFFMSSTTSQIAENVAESAERKPTEVEEKVKGASKKASRDIETLYSSMKKALQPSIDYERVKFVSQQIKILVRIYGFSIAAVDYMLVTFSIVFPSTALSRSLVGIIFGVTVIFSIFVIVIVADLSRYAGKINTAMKKLSGDSE